MKIAIGNDHIVTNIKNQVVKLLVANGHEIIDCGTSDTVRTHYPIYGMRVAQKVTSGKVDIGIVICGTGVGIVNGASKVKGARVALVRDVISAKIARQTLNANIIGFGGNIIGIGVMLEALEAFINTKFDATPQNTQNIEIIDNVIKNPISEVDDKNLLDAEIQKWEDGFYTNGVKQTKLTNK